MSVKITSESWHASDTGNATELLVLLALADNADTQSREAWPSVAYLAGKTKTSERAVQRALRGLKQRGQITAAAEANSRHRAVTYRVHPRPAKTQGRQIGTGATSGTLTVPPVAPEPSRTVKNNNGSRAQTSSKDKESAHG